MQTEQRIYLHMSILSKVYEKLVVCRSRTVDPHHIDLVLSGVSIRASPNLYILGVKFDRKLTNIARNMVFCLLLSLFRGPLSVLGPFLCIIYTSEMFELVEN